MAEEWLDLVAELLHVADERADVDYLEVVKGDLSIRFGRGGSGRRHVPGPGRGAAASRYSCGYSFAAGRGNRLVAGLAAVGPGQC